MISVGEAARQIGRLDAGGQSVASLVHQTLSRIDVLRPTRVTHSEEGHGFFQFG